MHRLTTVPLLCLAACGPFFKPSDEPHEPSLTLCVQNETVAYGNIVARAGMVRFDVMPGQEVCKPLIGTGGYVSLRASTTGGGASGPRHYEQRMPIGGFRCWRWRLTDSPASAADLGPCPEESEPETADPDTASADSSRAVAAY